MSGDDTATARPIGDLHPATVIPCRFCGAQPGQPCIDPATGEPLDYYPHGHRSEDYDRVVLHINFSHLTRVPGADSVSRATYEIAHALGRHVDHLIDWGTKVEGDHGLDDEEVALLRILHAFRNSLSIQESIHGAQDEEDSARS